MQKSILIIISCIIFIASGCSLANERSDSKEAISPTPAFIVSSYGSDLKEHEYKYFSHPQRIIALWQNSVETLIALGAGDKIIAFGGLANEAYLKPEHMPAFKQIPVRSRQVFSQETVLLMQPDFILGWYYDFSGKGRSIGTTDFWQKRGVNIYMNLLNGAEFQAVHRLEDEIKYIRDLGKITDKEPQAEKIISDIQNSLAPCQNALNNSHKPKVLIISSVDNNIAIYTPRTLPGDLVSKLGGIVIGKENERIGENELISLEEILLADPDVVFISSSPERAASALARFQNIPALRSLRCVKNNNCYTVPFYTIRSPGVRVIDAINTFAAGLQKAGNML